MIRVLLQRVSIYCYRITEYGKESRKQEENRG